jgi:hypothetical protein
VAEQSDTASSDDRTHPVGSLCEADLVRVAAIRLTVLLATMAVAVACSSEPTIEPEAARRHVIETLRAREESADRTTLRYETLEELLPNVDYTFEDGRVVHASEVAVVGTIVDVEKGRAFVVSDEHPDGVAADFDDPGAHWLTMHAIVKVEKSLGGRYDGDELKVGWTLTSREDFDVAAAGLKALGRVVLFLVQREGDDESSLWRIVQDGALLVTVADWGKLALPVLHADQARAFLASTPDLQSLEAAARSGGKTIPM